MSDPYIIIEGGVVQNYPALPVLDLDVLEEDARGAPRYVVEEVERLQDVAMNLNIKWVVDMWLFQNAYHV